MSEQPSSSGGTTSGGTAEALLAKALVASDRTYFSLGATVERMGPVEVLWMPGLTGVPAGCVGWVARTNRDPTDRVGDAIRRMEELGVGLVRIYCLGGDDTLAPHLGARGFLRRNEIGFVAQGAVGVENHDVRLRPAADDAGWDRRRDLYRQADLASDGHGGSADDFLAVERRKCATGSMIPYLIEVGGEVAGAVATLAEGPLLRLKNLYLAPVFRGRGVGAGVIYRAWELAARGPQQALGMFGVAGSRASALYASAGLSPATELTEWSLGTRLGR